MFQELTIVLIIFAPIVILGFFIHKANQKYFSLYKKIKSTDGILLPGEVITSLQENPIMFLPRLFMSPFIQWRILFQRHTNPELDQLALKARNLMITAFLVLLFEFILMSVLISLNLI